MKELKDMIEMPSRCRVCTECPCYDKWCNGYRNDTDCSYTLLSYFYHISCGDIDKTPEEHEQKDKDKPSKTIHELTIKVGRDILKGWDDPLGFMNGGYRSVEGQFDDGVVVKIKPFITLESDDSDQVYLYKDGKEVGFTSPYNLYNPICIEYNGEEYHIQIKR